VSVRFVTPRRHEPTCVAACPHLVVLRAPWAQEAKQLLLNQRDFDVICVVDHGGPVFHLRAWHARDERSWCHVDVSINRWPQPAPSAPLHVPHGVPIAAQEGVAVAERLACESAMPRHAWAAVVARSACTSPRPPLTSRSKIREGTLGRRRSTMAPFRRFAELGGKGGRSERRQLVRL
jgi:hypothetical protein